MHDSTLPAPLSIRLFGAFQVTVHGAPLPRLRSRKGQWLLALLVLRPGQEAERGWLAGTLWPDAAEAQAMQSLRVSLTDLRAALGAEARRLPSHRARTVALDLTGAVVDVADFDAGIATGTPAALERAVTLYRGPLLEECAEEWVVPERESRQQALLAALERLAEGARSAGEWEAAEAFLRRAMRVDPLREGLHRELMRVLAADGNHPAALMVYRELRLLLHRELNAEPDPETQTLFAQLRQEARIRAASPGGALAVESSKLGFPRVVNRASVTAAPAGGVPAESEEPLPAEARPQVALPVPGRATPHNLPRMLTRFIGREAEIAALRRMLAPPPCAPETVDEGGARLLTLVGAGGCGKTRLAVEVAVGLQERFPGGVWFVDLATLFDPRLVPQRVAAVVGAHEMPGKTPLEVVAEHLRSHRALLVLDNGEHLIAACAALAETLLTGCPELRLLVTSRESLRAAGERSYQVPSLSVPDPREGAMVDGRWSMSDAGSDFSSTLNPQPSTLMQSEAVRLFVDRAVAARADFALTAANADAVAQICRRLDGIALAIELAAARVKALAVDQILERLDDCFRLLTGGSRTALPRQQTLRALIDWSYDLLTGAEQALLRRLAVFSGGWTLEAAEGVLGAGSWELGAEKQTPQACSQHAAPRTLFPSTQHPAPDVLDLLTALVEKSLVVFSEAGGAPRYRMLEIIRQYAEGRLAESGETAWARERHARYCVALVGELTEGNIRDAAGAARVARLEHEHDNIRVALAWCRERSDADAALRLTTRLSEFWEIRGYVTEGRAHLEAALGYRGPAEPDLRRNALAAAGGLAARQGDYAAAVALLEEALADTEARRDDHDAARVLQRLGIIEQLHGDLTRARGFVERALELHERHADLASITWLRHELAAIALRGGDLATARDLETECLEQQRRFQDQRGIAWSLHNLGDVAFYEGDVGGAEQLHRESLTIREAMGDRRGIAWSLHRLGEVCRAQGDLGAAHARFAQSVAIRQDLGDRRGMVECLESLAAVAAAGGEALAAARLRGAAQAQRRTLPAPLWPIEQRGYDRTTTALQAALGPERCAVAQEAGKRLTLEEAILEALAVTVPWAAGAER